MLKPGGVRPLAAEALAALLEGGRGVGGGLLLIDSRPFVDFNASHIADAVNVNASKLLRRRLQQDKVDIGDVLRRSAGTELDLRAGLRVVVYDQNCRDAAALRSDAFAGVLLLKLERRFPSLRLLAGGFSEFSRQFPGLCEGKGRPSQPSCPSAPPSVSGPTRILPHLYLGCQRDVLNEEAMQRNAIAYVLNASSTCPKPDFIPDSHFLRVPVNDSFCEKILPWLDASLDFIEEAKASDACVLVHCLAGISRSATIAIAYIMKRMDMSLDEAYRFVKEKRPSISPNFNFLGQLLDFEKIISREARREGPPGRRPTEGPESPAPLEERPLARALCGLRLEDTARPKRRFSPDFNTYGEAGPAGDGASAPGKACQFSPVEEVSEQSPDKEEARGPLPATCRARDAAGFPFGLSRCQRRPSGPGPGPGGALEGRHSDILPGPSPSPPGGGRYRSSSAAYGGGHGPETVRRRGRPRAPDRGDSRRSWHEESNFEKTRSCHRWSENDLAKAAARDSFSASLELIRVS
ncbi:dual specificity protein phosphatase 16 [Phycodurus eques]|uniref:dual specificity protein phosphatase 16 n=1 Tax=Phycodurus eques TaxID=693459 RepID=UPI002ACD58DB|nr:dual specificity protein phosphatase 16 [Phycodurus eques]XP_061523480.1 dual specificity protein phosphatase 16 [Phycodurus eques]XP_061523481.1 dual specificity protein phosphatase 16 [Phycodurus eques]